MGIHELLKATTARQSAAFPHTLLLLALLLLLHLYFISPPPPTLFQTIGSSCLHTPKSNSTSAASAASTAAAAGRCDYSKGRWVRSTAALLYNGTSCGGIIKEGQNCMVHGRPDTSYLHYRWRPSGCNLPRFQPAMLLRLLRHRHVAFVGDSLARNQLESLLCLLSSHSPPTLLYSDGEDHNRNRRWVFPSHNLTVSLFWSPFLVHGVEKAPPDREHNELHLHLPDDHWLLNTSSADVIVLSTGHWFLHRGVYYDGEAVTGCHSVDNCTEVDFYGAFAHAYRTSLAAIVDRGSPSPTLVVVPTFSPAHFEGEWDRLGSCSKTEPYAQVEVGWMENEMRRLQVEEVRAARRSAAEKGVRLSVQALDVTWMAALRPDGHPGPYMNAFPFRDGVKERVMNDCVHWCLPGPIDAWNEVLLQLVTTWRRTEGRV